MNSFHPLGNHTCSIKSGEIVFPPECPWIARIYAKAFREVSQYSNPTLLLPLWIWSIHSESEKFSAPSFLNPLTALISVNPNVRLHLFAVHPDRSVPSSTPSSTLTTKESTQNNLDFLKWMSKNGPLREIHWFLCGNDRIRFQLAATRRINSVPFPEASFIVFGSICCFRVCLHTQQINTGDIVADVGIFLFHSQLDFSLLISAPKMFWNVLLLKRLQLRFRELQQCVRLLSQWLAQSLFLLELCTKILDRGSLLDHLSNLVSSWRYHLVDSFSTIPDHEVWRVDCARACHRMFSHLCSLGFLELLSVLALWRIPYFFFWSELVTPIRNCSLNTELMRRKYDFEQ